MPVDIEELRSALLILFGDHYFNEGAEVLLYGSQVKGRDIDLFVVRPGALPITTLREGNLDICFISTERLASLLALADPLVTDPILEGKVLLGNKTKWIRLREKLLNQEIGRVTIDHCLQRSMTELAVAEDFHAHYLAEGDDGFRHCAAVNLSFSISYASFAYFYKQPNRRITSFKCLREDGFLLFERFWSRWEDYKRGHALKGEEIGELLKTWSQISPAKAL